jgi:hypothetical protein
MTMPSFVLLRTAFRKVCDAEIAAHGRGPEIASQAAERLLHLLIKGRLQTWRSTRDGSNEKVSDEYWQSRTGSFKTDILPMDAFGGILVNDGELRSLLVEASAGSAVGPTLSNSEAKRGRPPAANPYDIAWVVGALVYAGEGLRSQEELPSKIAERYEARYGDGSAPSRSSLQPTVRRLLPRCANTTPRRTTLSKPENEFPAVSGRFRLPA